MDPPPTHRLVQIRLISARELKFPGGQRRMQCYAVAWVDPAAKVRTCTDLYFGEDPVWSEIFVFRVPPAFLHPDSNSGVNIEIYAAGGSWYRRDSLVGTTRLLVGSLCLVAGSPFSTAVCVRHNSGRIHGVLNARATLLSDANALTVGALSNSPAFSYREAEMVAELKELFFRTLISWSPSPAAERAVVKELKGENSGREGKGEGSVLKELKGENSRREEKGEREVLKGENSRREAAGAGAGTLCGLGFPPRRIHLSLSAQNLQISWAWWTVTIFLLALAVGFLRVVM